MGELFFSSQTIWFGIPAILGTLFFAIRIVLMLSGLAGDHGLDVDVHTGDVAHGDSTQAFQYLSIQSIIAFARGFGWAGLVGARGLDWSTPSSFLLGIGGGVAMVWLLAILMRAMVAMESSGNIRLDDMLDAEGEVYAGVPARGQGRGQVRVLCDNRQRIVNAIAFDGPLPTKTRVRVVEINQDNTVTVAAT
ncbi:MAG: hypothetical protein SFZ23_06275 [Planctomycetota bacterium]|nr:hypothetical protein [Planctomycetota bacterium]